MPFDVLDWSIIPVVQTTFVYDSNHNESPGHDIVYLQVKPVVNGVTIETPWQFDTVALLVRQNQDYYCYDMFTCHDCGVAGCAGIHDYVHMRVSQDTVQWQFPRIAPFIEKLVPVYFETTAKPMLWTFDALQYRACIAGLVERFKAFETTQALPVQLWPASEGFKTPSPTNTLAAQIEDWQKSMSAHLDLKRADAAYWGVLYEAEATIAVASGTRVYSVSELLDHTANIIVGIDSRDDAVVEKEQEDLHAKCLDEQICYYREHPEKLVVLIKNFSWEQLQDKHFMSSGEHHDLQQNIAQRWPYVDITLALHVPLTEKDWSEL